MTPLHWFFFGVACMVNAPTDCTRVVFDQPMRVTDLRYTVPSPPLVFDNPGDCMNAIPLEFDRHKPYAVEGSEWVEIGCTMTGDRNASH
jgi:hypothetical protein